MHPASHILYLASRTSSSLSAHADIQGRSSTVDSGDPRTGGHRDPSGLAEPPGGSGRLGDTGDHLPRLTGDGRHPHPHRPGPVSLCPSGPGPSAEAGARTGSVRLSTVHHGRPEHGKPRPDQDDPERGPGRGRPAGPSGLARTPGDRGRRRHDPGRPKFGPAPGSVCPEVGPPPADDVNPRGEARLCGRGVSSGPWGSCSA